MLFLRHPAWLWIKKHQKHLIPPIDPSLQAKFDEGNQFEAYVESLFPNLTKLGFENYSDYLNLPTQTINAWENGAEIVSQGRYEHGRLTCISDLVRKDKEGFILTEIKSSTKAKEEHTLDLGFQKVVMELCGFSIIKCEVAHVNKDYTLNGPINPDDLVNFTDITGEVESVIQITKERIDRAINVIDSPQMPDPSPARA